MDLHHFGEKYLCLLGISLLMSMVMVQNSFKNQQHLCKLYCRTDLNGIIGIHHTEKLGAEK
jgi:hypothetical protein